MPPLQSPPHKQYQKSKLTKQQQTQQQCQLQEDVNSLAKKHVNVKRIGKTKFNSYKKHYEEEEQQELLLQQQQLEAKAMEAAEDTSETTKKSGSVQVLPINNNSRNTDRRYIATTSRIRDSGSNSSSYIYYGGRERTGNMTTISGGSGCGGGGGGGDDAGGHTGGGNIGDNNEGKLNLLHYVNSFALQAWKQKFADTIKEVIFHLVPFLAFPELVSLSKSCKHFAQFDSSSSASSTVLLSASSATSKNIAFFSLSNSGTEVASKDTIAASLAVPLAASTTLQNPQYVRTILDIQLTKVLSRFKFTLQTLQNIFNAHPGSVLSGSSILQAYLGIQYERFDLDFYLPFKEEAKEFLIQTLERRDGEQRDAQGCKNYLKRVVPPILEFLGLPKNIYYSSVKLKWSPYFPLHQGFILELEQLQYVRDLTVSPDRPAITKQKLQFIFIQMGTYKYPPEESCGFVIDYFDISIVKSYYDGSHFHSRCIKDIVNRTMTLCTPQNGVRRVNILTMVRLIKYGQERKIQFLGPILPLEDGAKDVYKEYLKQTRGQERYFLYKKLEKQQQKPIPTKDKVCGEWINAAAKADVYFDYSDSDGSGGPDRHIGQWRRLRSMAMKFRKNDRPSLSLEAHLQGFMPKKYSLHRRMLAPGWQPPPKPTADQLNGLWFEKVREAIPSLFNLMEDSDDDHEVNNEPTENRDWRKELRIANYRRYVQNVPDHELEDYLQSIIPRKYFDVLEKQLLSTESSEEKEAHNSQYSSTDQDGKAKLL